jgi:hypothetical protein
MSMATAHMRTTADLSQYDAALDSVVLEQTSSLATLVGRPRAVSQAELMRLVKSYQSMQSEWRMHAAAQSGARHAFSDKRMAGA